MRRSANTPRSPPSAHPELAQRKISLFELPLRLWHSGGIENGVQRALSQWRVSVMRNRYGMVLRRVLPNVMATANTMQHVAMCRQQTLNFLGGQRLHAGTRSERTRLRVRVRNLPMAIERYASRQPSAASMTLTRHSEMVSPSEAQPGIAGISPQYPPSSALCTTTFQPFSSLNMSPMFRIIAHAQLDPQPCHRLHYISGILNAVGRVRITPS